MHQIALEASDTDTPGKVIDMRAAPGDASSPLDEGKCPLRSDAGKDIRFAARQPHRNQLTSGHKCPDSLIRKRTAWPKSTIPKGKTKLSQTDRKRVTANIVGIEQRQPKRCATIRMLIDSAAWRHESAFGPGCDIACEGTSGLIHSRV